MDISNPPSGAGSGNVTGPAGAVDGQIVLFSGVTGLLIKAASGTGYVLATAGVYSVQTGIPAADVTGTLAETHGGTNQSTYARGDLLVATAVNTLGKLTVGGNGTFLSSNGTDPSYRALLAADIPSLAASIITSGTFAEARGGTNQSTYATGDILYASAANTLSKLAAGTNGQVMQQVAGIPSWQTIPQQNLLLNGNFDFWQRGTTITIANTVSTYLPDRWYGKNSLGTNGILTLSQVAGVSDGAPFGAKLQITTAPTAAQVNGCELYQTLDNKTSLQFYNKSASFQVKVKSFGNVNQVGIQFFYKTTEAKVDTSIGAEVTAAVNTATFTTINLSNQAIGTSQTAAGVIGVRIRITGVSAGNLYDLNNGFVVEQAIASVAPAIAGFTRAYPTAAAEQQACLAFYWRFTGAASPFNYFTTGYFDSTTAVKTIIQFPVTMRVAPTPSVSAGTDLAIDRATSSTASGSGSPSFASTTTNTTRMSATSGTASTAGFPTIVGLQSGGFFQADAEI